MMNRFGDIDVSFKRLPPVYGYHSEELVSIEKALEPIESQIRELSRYIKIAKQHCHFPSEHGLTKDQSAAVYIYTMEWGETTLYRVLNKALRSENRQALNIWFPYLKLFDTALDKLPTVKEILWRGVALDIGKNYTKNQLVTWWSVNSCSSSANVIKNFLGNDQHSTLFLIEGINGKKISDYTEYKDEDEIILRMGTQFRVKSNTLEQSNGSHIVHLVEIDDNDDEPLASTMNEIHVTPKSSNQGTSDEPYKMHVAPHNGYSIKKTREFIIKYAPYLRTTLKIAQVLLKLGSFIIPQLNSVSKTANSGVDTILPTPDKQKEMEQQLNMVEKLLDRVDHKWAQSKSTMFGQDKSNGVPLQRADLREVETYLDVADNKRSLGNLYRTVTVDGYVRWVCLEHYDDISFSNTMSKYIDQLEAMGGESLIFNHININTKWKQHGVIVTGGNGYGNQPNQLYLPHGIYVDDDHQTIYIADTENGRIVEWKYGEKNGKIVAGGNGIENRSDQLNYPRNVIVDKKNDSLIVCDGGSRRVVRWSLENGTNGETIISDIDCYDLTIDKNGDLYVSDRVKNEVRRWKQGEKEGTIVAGGNGQGNYFNQLHCPTYIFVDEDQSVYVSDRYNHRVMKWMKGAKEGIVVAGGNDQGNSLTQLSHPAGVIVDRSSNVYVADYDNHRIMRWCEGSCEGSVVAGGNGKGEQLNQLNYPTGLSFDIQGNLYVVDCLNNRIQKFDIDDEMQN
ncbi:unnamed protein product [Adineta steineri]|uniref:NAD(P)(+)--arginine ADP-ribosyltransferase n=1 Tax=Adineta steineri TaxID=433720 RepID=A0A819G3A8_9BILA|nr:unnamed protein product [Adineta steineri]